MELVRYDDEVLTNGCQHFDFANPPFDPVEFAQDLTKFMYENNGVGLAANQVGIPYRIFAMRGHPENFVCYNPKIIVYGNDQVVLEEGCLTFPGLLVKIKRSNYIKVRFQTPNSETITKEFIGLSSRIFQHEFDHLDGIVFYKKANKFHRDQAMKRWKQ